MIVGPPPPLLGSPAHESAIPELPTEQGSPVPAFADLLAAAETIPARPLGGAGFAADRDGRAPVLLAMHEPPAAGDPAPGVRAEPFDGSLPFAAAAPGAFGVLTEGRGPMPRPGEADGSPAPAIAELLGGASAVPAPVSASREIGFTSNGRDFRGIVRVGEDAIRFDARPVVAPVNLSPGEGPAEVAAMSPGVAVASGMPASPAPGLPGKRTETPEPALRAVQAARAAAGGLPAATHEGVARPGAAMNPVGQAIAAEPAGKAARGEARSAAPPGAVGDARPPRAGAAADRARPPVSAFLTPGDVLVVLHGIALSAAEHKTLLQDVRELLAAHGLGGRAIRLHTESRRTR